MIEKKYYVCFDGLERGKMVNCLNEIRTKLNSKGEYHDAVDDLLLKSSMRRQSKSE